MHSEVVSLRRTQKQTKKKKKKYKTSNVSSEEDKSKELEKSKCPKKQKNVPLCSLLFLPFDSKGIACNPGWKSTLLTATYSIQKRMELLFHFTRKGNMKNGVLVIKATLLTMILMTDTWLITNICLRNINQAEESSIFHLLIINNHKIVSNLKIVPSCLCKRRS